MNPRDPYADSSGVLINRLGITDPDVLADQLRHAVHPAADLAEGTLASTQGRRSELSAAEHFRAMREHRTSTSSAPYEGSSTT